MKKKNDPNKTIDEIVMNSYSDAAKIPHADDRAKYLESVAKLRQTQVDERASKREARTKRLEVASNFVGTVIKVTVPVAAAVATYAAGLKYEETGIHTSKLVPRIESLVMGFFGKIS